MTLTTISNIPETSIEWEKQIAQGSYAVVWKAEWHGSPAAVKVLRGAPLLQEQVEEFNKEVIAMSNLRHRNIVQIYGTTEKSQLTRQGKVFARGIVMEYCAKGSLYDVLHGSEQVLPETVLQFARDIASGLSFLHSKKLLHLDMKSPNILVTKNNELKIADFGISRIRENVRTIVTKKTMGTVRWLCPEILIYQDSKLSNAADIYAMGVIFWELYSKQKPWDGLNTIEIAKKVRAGKRPEVNSQWPEFIKGAIARCWKGNRHSRPSAERVLLLLKKAEKNPNLTTIQVRETLLPGSENIERGVKFLRNNQAEEAVAEFLQAVKLRNLDGYYHLGVLYENGAQGILKDLSKANSMYELGAKRNHVRCAFQLGQVFKYKMKDLTKALRWHEIGFNAHHPESMYEYGHTLYLTAKTQQDRSLALGHIRDAANAGSKEASYRYGRFLQVGQDIKLNLTEAVVYLERAAQQGHIRACYYLALLYHSGTGEIAKNLEKAARYYKVLADRQFYLDTLQLPRWDSEVKRLDMTRKQSIRPILKANLE